MNGQFDIGDISPQKYFLGVASVLGVLFAFITPDLVHIGFLQLLLIWQIQTVGAIIIVIISHLLLIRYFYMSRLNRWMQLFLSGLIGASLFSPIGLFVDIHLANEGFPAHFSAELFDEWSAIAPPVTIAWVVLNAPWIIGYRITTAEAISDINLKKTSTVEETHEITDSLANHPANTKPLENLEPSQGENHISEFWALIPSHLGRDILYLESELHYLKVVTSAGSTLILFSLKEAAIELGEDVGLVCHRSFWVAKKHISEFKKQGRQGVVILNNGDKVPVSRRKVNEVGALVNSSLQKIQQR